MTLGVVLAGGRSTRFGSDKALAVLAGKPLLDRAIDRLADWCDEVVVAGRASARCASVPDWPGPGLGPLGGLAAALRHARSRGHDAVLAIPLDSFDLPDNLPDLLAPGPSFVAGQPVIGLWPVSALEPIEGVLRGEGRHSMLRFAEVAGARSVQLESEPCNINTPADLEEAETRHGL